MCFLLQLLLFLGAVGVAWLIHVPLGAPYWAGGLGGTLFFLVTWIGYLVYQGTHPDWWAPWDDGLPQESRMANVFVPALGVFLALLVLFPILNETRRRNLEKRQKQQVSYARRTSSVTEQIAFRFGCPTISQRNFIQSEVSVGRG